MNTRIVTTKRPYIVGIGGSYRPNSTSAAALRTALEIAERAGAQTRAFGAAELEFPLFRPDSPDNATPMVVDFVDQVRASDGLIIASPAYHGGVTGTIKNALDHLELLAGIDYLGGRAVGCITCGYGDQAPVQALNALRTYVHHLRGWPTPLGVTIIAYPSAANEDGRIGDGATIERIERTVRGVIEFTTQRLGAEAIDAARLTG